MAGFDASFAQLVGPHPVDAAHHNVAEDDRVSGAGDQLEVQLKARIVFEARHIRADDLDLLHAGFPEGAADKADVVGSAAAAACLRHNDRGPVQVVFAGAECLHDLSHDKEGRVAGVIVDIFEAVVHRLAVVVGQDHEIISAGVDGRFEKIEVDRRHLRSEDRIVLAHVLRKADFFDRCVAELADGLLGVADADRRDQGTHADAGAAQVVDLVDLEAGVDFVRAGQDIAAAHIAGGGVEP